MINIDQKSYLQHPNEFNGIRRNSVKSNGLPPTIFEGQMCALKEGKNPCYRIREWTLVYPIPYDRRNSITYIPSCNAIPAPG